jgi:hypothetical protein
VITSSTITQAKDELYLKQSALNGCVAALRNPADPDLGFHVEQYRAISRDIQILKCEIALAEEIQGGESEVA